MMVTGTKKTSKGKKAFVLDPDRPPRPADKYDAPRLMADKAPVGFHAMIKPAGSACNLDCTYCFYLSKAALAGGPGCKSMSDDTLELLIRSYIRDVTTGEVVFTWQGGEPTLRGLDFFGIYHDGWMASTFGPRTPWVAQVPDLANWDPMQDQWQLFDTRKDYSLMNDLASQYPEKLEELKALFMKEAEANKALPIGGALHTGLNPHEMKRSSNTEWTLFDGMTRIPESEAPNVRNGNIRAEIEANVSKGVNGVIFAMGGYAGGVSLYALDGVLYYEYSALLLKRDRIKVGALPAGDVTIAFEMRTPLQRAASAELTFWINGKEAAQGKVQRTVPAVFTASETFDVGMDTSSPVANDYFNKAPFKFQGTLKQLHFKNLPVEQPAFVGSPDDD